MIPPETIQQIKERTDIVAFIGDVVKLIRRGRSYVGLCPFHKEKSPSFYVHPDRGFYHCFGCAESGSAIDFAMKVNGLDFREAAQLLADRAGITIEDTKGDARSRGAGKTERDELFDVLALAATFFERCLGLGAPQSAHPCSHHAARELGRRGMPDPTSSDPDAVRWRDTVQAFRVGYAPPGWDALSKYFKQNGVSHVLAERAGLLVPGQRGHYDRFRHRLMFSVFDPLGRVVAFSGRALDPPTQEELAHEGPSPPTYGGDKDVAKYVNSPESPVFTKGEQLFGIHQAKQSIRSAGEAILVEGNFDVVTLHARGIDRVVAPLGTAFTSAQAKLIKRFAPKVVVMFDGDGAGRKATRSARVPCREAGLDARVAVLPKGLDPDELVRTKGPEVLLDFIGGARGMLEFLMKDALDDGAFLGGTLAEQSARVRAAVGFLAEEKDPNLRGMAKTFADQLSDKLIVAGAAPADLRELERMVHQAIDSPAPSRNDPRQHGGSDPGRDPQSGDRDNDRGPGRRGPRGRHDPASVAENLGRAILGALIDYPELTEEPAVQTALSALSGDVALAAAATRQLLRPGQVASDFLAALPTSIHSFAAGRLASPVFDDPSQAKTDLLDNSKKIGALLFERDKADARNVLGRAPASLDQETEELLREIERKARRKRNIDE